MEGQLKYESVKEQIQNIFCAKEKSRPSLMVPQDFHNKINDVKYWCVTDAHIAAFIPHDLIGPARSEALNYGHILNSLTPLETPLLFTLNEFRAGLSNLDSEPEVDIVTKDCEQCNGSGICRCSCSNRHDCSECNGEGEIEVSRNQTGRLYYTNKDHSGPVHVFKMGCAIFDPNLISKIGNGIKLLGLQNSIIQVTHNHESQSSVPEVGDVIFLIMPLLPTENQEIKYILPIPNN